MSLLRLEACVVDLAIGRITRDGATVQLTTRELDLLRFLADRPGATVPREVLHADVFGYGPRTHTRAVDKTMTRLRQKVERAPAAPRHLLTAHGTGYRYEPLLASAPAVPLVGRADVLASLGALAAGGARRIDLVGPPGAGKTTLARASAPAVEVDLAGARDPVAAVGRALRVGPDADAIGRALAARGSIVLLLDDADACEGVEAPVARWLAVAPDLTVLITSRRTLPGAAVVLRVEGLAPGDGTALFVERAAAAGATVGADDPAVRAICARLDGLPLAIELAATRTTILDPAAILDRLDRDLAVVAAGSTSMEAAVRTSWELLDGDLRDLLVQVTVFAGPFLADDAERMVRTGGSVLDGLQALVARSLIHARTWEGRRWLAPYHVVAAFAARQADRAVAVAWHARWALARGAEASAAIDGPEPALAVRELRRLVPELQAIVGRQLPAPVRAHAHLLLVRAHELDASYADWEREASAAVALAETGSAIEADARIELERVRWSAHRRDSDEENFHRILELCDARGWRGRALVARANHATMRLRHGDPEPARALAAREPSDVGPYEQAKWLWLCALLGGDGAAGVLADWERLVRFCRTRHLARVEAHARLKVARAQRAAHRVDDAERSFRVAAELGIRNEDVTLEYAALVGLADLQLVAGEDPRPALDRALRIARDRGDLRREGLALLNLGAARLAWFELREAAVALTAAIELVRPDSLRQRGLLVRAAVHAFADDPDGARADLARCSGDDGLARLVRALVAGEPLPARAAGEEGEGAAIRRAAVRRGRATERPRRP